MPEQTASCGRIASVQDWNQADADFRVANPQCLPRENWDAVNTSSAWNLCLQLELGTEGDLKTLAGRFYRVLGDIKAIEVTVYGIPEVVLNAEERGEVRCQMNREQLAAMADLNIGDKLNVGGTFLSFASGKGLILENCSIIEENP